VGRLNQTVLLKLTTLVPNYDLMKSACKELKGHKIHDFRLNIQIYINKNNSNLNCIKSYQRKRTEIQHLHFSSCGKSGVNRQVNPLN